MTSRRQSWDQYFMTIAHAVATRATCDRKHVGCVLTVGKRIVATGYNGSIQGTPHCDDVGHDMHNGHCVRTMHAEANAVAQAAQYGIKLQAATAYINTFPCWPCFKALASAGITRIVYDDEYREDERVKRGAEQAMILVQGPGVWKVP